jgi:hypothetical protein
MGETLERMAELHIRAAIPADIRTGEYAAETTTAFCDALDDHAAPLRDSAREAYDTCI